MDISNTEFIILKIFKDKSKLDDFKVYICNMNEKIIDIKNKILKDIFNSSDILREKIPNEFNYLDFENITEKIYKDYGKLFFDKGLLPRTIDNYRIKDFTIDNREFSFLCIPNIIENPKLIRNNFHKKIRKENTYKAPQKENKFVFNEDDFPPLK
jgi:hypothetical protein